ncbi:DUF4202 domain-containing protein [Sphingobacterium sp. LRF_L2]|uniref:DUF4202 domain-containing protein n=1 Tax=Sphingobacterium sp. LRF_L2 TaxID=3369421 RepID=UPI003F6403E9
MSSHLEKAIARFDDYNKKDPTIFVWEGKQYPQEYFLSLKLYEWVLKLDPEANDALILASRSQHIGRWEIPRNHYPMDKDGYLKWRRELSSYHATKARTILEELNYSEELITEVEQIVLKKKIKVSPSVQTMENALCLVFLAYQYEDFFPKHEDKIVNILKKSLLKMDAHGHQFALKLTYSEKGLHYIQMALAEL